MDDLFDNSLYSANPDHFISLLMGGIMRAQDRFRSKLNIVDENGEVLMDNERIEIDYEKLP